jgi:hypothetical protein
MAGSSTSSRAPLASIGARLERDRLEGRARRLERVVDVLRARAQDHAARGSRVPLGLASSLDDFQRELGMVRRLLHGTDTDATTA